jgi:hypothetical protein
MHTLSQAVFSPALLRKCLFYKGFLQRACRVQTRAALGRMRVPGARAVAMLRFSLRSRR